MLWNDLNDVKSLDDVLDQITLVGKATGKATEADALITSLRARIHAVTETARTAAAGPPPAVYHEVDSTFYSISDGTFIGDLYRIAGARNIAGDGGGTPYPQLTQEAIIAANPQVIVLADEPFGTTADSVKQRAGWQNIDAVRNNRVYAIDPDIASRAGPRIVDALEQIASFVRGTLLGHAYPQPARSRRQQRRRRRKQERLRSRCAGCSRRTRSEP